MKAVNFGAAWFMCSALVHVSFSNLGMSIVGAGEVYMEEIF